MPMHQLKGASVADFTAYLSGHSYKGVWSFPGLSRRGSGGSLHAHDPSDQRQRQRRSQSREFEACLGDHVATQGVTIKIVLVGELQSDKVIDGLEFCIPKSIFQPSGGSESSRRSSLQHAASRIVVDISLCESMTIQHITSPSHPISFSYGTSSTDPWAAPLPHKASVSLELDDSRLTRDYILHFTADGLGASRASLMYHPTLANQRAVACTFMPELSMPSAFQEIVLLVDASGSMEGIEKPLKDALGLCVKVLPPGTLFNLCYFGGQAKFLWPESRALDASSFQVALDFVQEYTPDMGLTETQAALNACIRSRSLRHSCQIMLITDGDDWFQSDFLSGLNRQVQQSWNTPAPLRIFALGIGEGIVPGSLELIEKAGGGFSEFCEREDDLLAPMARLMEGALSVQAADFTLDLGYVTNDRPEEEHFYQIASSHLVQAISYSDHFTSQTYPASNILPAGGVRSDVARNYEQSALGGATTNNPNVASVPPLSWPPVIQAPAKLPSLFPFHPIKIWLILSEDIATWQPTCVILSGKMNQGRDLSLRAPVHYIVQPSETNHQLAATRIIRDLERHRGWIQDITFDGSSLRAHNAPLYTGLLSREIARTSVRYQVPSRLTELALSQTPDEQTGDLARNHLMQTMPERGTTDVPLLSFAPETGHHLSGSVSEASSSTAWGTREMRNYIPTLSGGPRRGMFSGGAAAALAVRQSPSPSFSGDFSPAAPSSPVSVSSRATSNIRSLSIDAVTTSALPGREQLLMCLFGVRFDGHWERNDVPGHLMLDPHSFRDSVRHVRCTAKDLATAVVVRFLESRYRTEPVLHRLLAIKARRWLERHLRNSDMRAAVWREASRLVGV